MIILIVVFLSDYADCKSIYNQIGCWDGSWLANPVFIF